MKFLRLLALLPALALASQGMGPGPGLVHASGGGGGSIAFVQNTTCLGNGVLSVTCTLTGVSASDVLVAACFSINGGATTPTGFTVGDVPTAFAGMSGTNLQSFLYFRTSPPSGTNAVVIPMAGSGAIKCSLSEFSGINASPLDVATSPANADILSTSGTNTATTGTLAQATELVFAVVTTDTGGSGSANTGISDPPSGFTSLAAATASNSEICGEISYKIVAAATSVSAVWNWTDTNPISTQAIAVSLKN